MFLLICIHMLIPIRLNKNSEESSPTKSIHFGIYNLLYFRPPKLPKENFFLETENPADILVTPQAYKRMVREGKLRKSIINDEILHGKVQEPPK